MRVRTRSRTRRLDSALLTVDRWPWQLSQAVVGVTSEVYVKESVVRGHHKMRYSFSSRSSFSCISLLLLEITRGSGGGCVYARMRGITPARPQFETGLYYWILSKYPGL